jgi:excisionase family DNA binding protein
MPKKPYRSNIPPRPDATTPLPEVLTITEAAGVLRKSKDGLRKWIQRGQIPAIRVGREYRIHRSVLETYLNNCPPIARPPDEIVGDTVGLQCLDDPELTALVHTVC